MPRTERSFTDIVQRRMRRQRQFQQWPPEGLMQRAPRGRYRRPSPLGVGMGGGLPTLPRPFYGRPPQMTRGMIPRLGMPEAFKLRGIEAPKEVRPFMRALPPV